MLNSMSRSTLPQARSMVVTELVDGVGVCDGVGGGAGRLASGTVGSCGVGLGDEAVEDGRNVASVLASGSGELHAVAIRINAKQSDIMYRLAVTTGMLPSFGLAR